MSFMFLLQEQINISSFYWNFERILFFSEKFQTSLYWVTWIFITLLCFFNKESRLEIRFVMELNLSKIKFTKSFSLRMMKYWEIGLSLLRSIVFWLNSNFTIHRSKILEKEISLKFFWYEERLINDNLLLKYLKKKI